MIRHVRRRSVVGQYLARAPWCRRGINEGFFDSLFLADSGGEEQDDWLLG